MPKIPMDYSKCSIYKIEHVDDDTLVYVGHTTNFDKRKTAHKYYCKKDNNKHYNLKVYQMIRQNGGWDAFKMLEVEKYPCADKREAERRENEVMKELKASMNMRKSFRTQDEITEYTKEHNTNYYEVHKEKLQQHHKDYYELHKEKLQEYQKEYQKNNKPKIQEYKKEYQKNNKPKIQEYKKEYRESNKLKIQERDKEYREANKQKINEKVKCECGCDVMKRCLKQHQATKKHLDKMKNI